MAIQVDKITLSAHLANHLAEFGLSFLLAVASLVITKDKILHVVLNSDMRELN